jgi:hypothetical protein
MTTRASSLAELPSDRVLRLYSYGLRKWTQTPASHPDEPYYYRMQELAMQELQVRLRREQASLELIK